jgi:hypothetical protein
VPSINQSPPHTAQPLAQSFVCICRLVSCMGPFRLILSTFFDQLTEDRQTCCHFMQDSAKAHIANKSMNGLAKFSVNE